MDFILNLVITAIDHVWLTLLHNWPYLVLSTVVAVLIKQYMDVEKVSTFLRRNRRSGVAAATAAAVATPLCSCGTMAILLGMMSSMMPWAPIVAFMVASPLTSPEELFYSAGLFGWPFAVTFFIASIALGLAGGAAAAILENRGFLRNQSRFADSDVRTPLAQSKSEEIPAPSFSASQSLIPVATLTLAPCCAAEAVPLAQPPISNLFAAPCSCGVLEPSKASSTTNLDTDTCSCSASQPAKPSRIANLDTAACSCGGLEPAKSSRSLETLLNEMLHTGARLLVLFLGFAFIGYLLNGLIPPEWIVALFGSGRVYSVPLAATLGLPFYINTESSLPLVRAMLDAGMSPGAAMAFMISGAGTSIGAIGGALTIARWRVVALVIATLWAGAIAFGLLYNAALAIGLF